MRYGCYLSAARQSSGKTSVAVGLTAALTSQGHRVQTFKKGPDFIDPSWLAAASGAPCYSLDPYLEPLSVVRERFAKRAHEADVALVEGNMGLFDGMDKEGSDSNAAIAKALRLPVVLVFDAQGVTRTAAALLLGLAHFDPELPIAGVILNRVASARHEAKLRASIEATLPFPVLGVLPRLNTPWVDERHLGLVPAAEEERAEALIAALREWVVAGVDLAALLAAIALPEEKAEGERPGAELRPSVDRGKSAEPAVAASDLKSSYPTLLRLGEGTRSSRRRRVAVALDRAFHFYYPDDWEAFATLGVELVPFDTLSYARLPPQCNALWLGGGFPEMAAAALAENQRLRREIAAAARDGLPIYAECGGLMYLCERLVGFDGRAHSMCGVLPAEVAMEAKAVGRGYVHLVATADHSWSAVPPVVRAHEFHHSRLHWLDTAPPRFAWTVKRGFGIDGDHDGVVWHNVLAGYAHLRSLATWSWVAAWCATWSDTSPAARAVPLIEEVV